MFDIIHRATFQFKELEASTSRTASTSGVAKRSLTEWIAAFTPTI